MIARGLQGAAMGVYMVMGRAIASDILEAEKLNTALASLATTWAIGPIIGPIIGGYLQYYFNWQACFWFFAIYGGCGFFAFLFYLPETIQHKLPFEWQGIKNTCTTLFRHKAFMGSTLVMGAAYSILIAFSVLGPFIIQITFEKSVVYFGRIALASGCAFLLGTLLCRYGVKRFPAVQLLRYSLWAGWIIILACIAYYIFLSSDVILLILATLLLTVVAAVLYTSSVIIGVSFFRNIIGSASAIMSCINLLITSCVSFIASFTSATLSMLLLSYALLLLLALLSYKKLLQ